MAFAGGGRQDEPVSPLHAVRTTGIVCRIGCASRAQEYLHSGPSVLEAAERLHVSDRHLRRLVRQETGLKPRTLVRR